MYFVIFLTYQNWLFKNLSQLRHHTAPEYQTLKTHLSTNIIIGIKESENKNYNPLDKMSESKFKKISKTIKKSWNWVWHSDSILSWIIALVIIYIIVKFIFFPTLSLIMGTSLPLAGVESSSMDHQIVKEESPIGPYNRLKLCGNVYTSQEKHSINFDEYWKICGDWYREKNITKQKFEEFPLKNGFKKGDIIVVWGRFEPKIGDVIIFKPNPSSSAPRPIIHRVVEISGDTMQTKGDHNEKQLTASNNIYNTDETNIKKDQIIGKAILRIPYLGWPKIWLTDSINSIRYTFS
jgi:signal peptidase I